MSNCKQLINVTPYEYNLTKHVIAYTPNARCGSCLLGVTLKYSFFHGHWRVESAGPPHVGLEVYDLCEGCGSECGDIV